MGAKEKDGPRLLFRMGAAPRVCPSQQWSPFFLVSSFATLGGKQVEYTSDPSSCTTDFAAY